MEHYYITVEPWSKGHFGNHASVLSLNCREAVLFSEVENYIYILLRILGVLCIEVVPFSEGLLDIVKPVCATYGSYRGEIQLHVFILGHAQVTYREVDLLDCYYF